jgi:predicted RNase H-like nuclease
VLFLGVDLAWGEGSEDRPANCSGVVALGASGEIHDADWTVGLAETQAWIERHALEDTLLFVDAPLVITNLTRQRLADKQVGQRYGRWLVSANSVNLSSPRQAGVRLRERLEEAGWSYSDGREGPPHTGHALSECYPYATIVGAEELGYEDARPPYKRRAKGMRAAQFFPMRIAACDELIRRVSDLAMADPPMDLASHPRTRALIEEPSPRNASAYKPREDLLDAAICAWTAALWHRHGDRRCQVLGGVEHDGAGGPIATIITPARPEQRRD